MKKLIFYISVLFCFITNAQTKYFYYYNGNKIPLKLDTNSLNIISDDIKSIPTSRIYTPIEQDNKSYIKMQSVGNVTEREFESQLENLKKASKIVGLYFKNGEKSIGTSKYFYVKIKRPNDFQVLKNFSSERNVEIISNVPNMPLWYILAVTDSKYTSLEMSNLYYESKLFSDIDPAFIFDFKGECANDPYFKDLWGLGSINICKAWNLSTGSGVNVAVVDQGVDKSHNDLRQNIHPLSFNTVTGKIGSDFESDEDHGTHVAGIVSAVKDNHLQVVGVAPNAKIMSVSNPLVVSANISAELANGISWAWKNGADVINNSWGDQGGNLYENLHSSILEEAISEAITQGRNGKGTIVLFASGNFSPKIDYPAYANPDILVVGAIQSDKRRWVRSGYGKELDVVAPGVGILSTTPNNSLYSYNGTSMACPHVAGVAALILSVNPNLTAKQVSDIIEKTAQKVGGYNYQNDPNHPNGTWNYEMGYGLVDAYEAVKTAKQMLVPKPNLIITNTMPWGFCKKAIFKVENFPLDEKNATIDWKFPLGSRITKEIAKNEVEIDFATNYSAEVHAIVNTKDYRNLNLEVIGMNNNYVRSDMLCMQLEKEKDNKYKMNFVLDSLTIRPLTPYQRRKIINVTTNNCVLSSKSEQEYLEITGSNPLVKATITLAPETCSDEPITFHLKNLTSNFIIVPTEESKLLDGNKPENKTDTCDNPEEIKGEVFSNGWYRARTYYFDFYEYQSPDDQLDIWVKYKTSAPTSRVSTGYFEIVPAKGYITAHSPMKIQATPNGAELFIDSPQYIGYQEWGKAWIRYVPEDCKASKWELWDFSKAGYATNGYFAYRDKNYASTNFYMYPNPSSNTVFLSVKPQTESRRGVSLFSAQKHALQNEPYQIEMFNTAGVRVLHQEGKGTIAEFSVAHLPAGIYIVHFTQNGVTHKEKLIVE
ncbi:S8 family serine peptidase [Capnocytophaga ochracea]